MQLEYIYTYNNVKKVDVSPKFETVYPHEYSDTPYPNMYMSNLILDDKVGIVGGLIIHHSYVAHPCTTGQFSEKQDTIKNRIICRNIPDLRIKKILGWLAWVPHKHN